MVLGVVAAGESSDLAVSWWPAELGDAAVDPEALHRRVLLAQVAELRLSYSARSRAIRLRPGTRSGSSLPCPSWSASSCAFPNWTSAAGRT